MEQKEEYWFVRRKYGWGWTPGNWKGLFTLVSWAIIFVIMIFIAYAKSNSVMDMFYISIIPLITITLVMWIVCWMKGEKPKWQWGY
jgi:hypothetical protein